MPSGSLTVVGTGIQFLAQLTTEARASIERADQVFFALADPASQQWIRSVNVAAEPFEYFTTGKPRAHTYGRWVEQMLAPVYEGKQVCAVFYGHAGVGVPAAHEALRRARREGFPARMLPGLSAEDCLYADLGLNPLQHGCQSFDATDFLTRRRIFDPRSVLVLWQVDLIGERAFDPERPSATGLGVLRDRLLEHYASEHEAIVYEASRLVVMAPDIQRLSLSALPEARISGFSILCILPA